MAFTFGFYNSLNGDRKYNAEQISAVLGSLITDGVFNNVGELLATVPGEGMQVILKTGRAWFDDTWNNNDSGLPLSVELSDLILPRYDAVVIETNKEQSARLNKPKIVTGIPAVNPVKPQLVNTGHVKQHPLAYIRVEAASTTIPANKIEIVVGKNECPFVTGVLATASLEDLYQDWQYDFDVWFDNLKQQLTDDVVTNLQRQIDERLKIADKATTAEANSGVSDTKWMSPSTTKSEIIQFGGFVKNQASRKFQIITTTTSKAQTVGSISASVYAATLGAPVVLSNGLAVTACTTPAYEIVFLVNTGNGSYTTRPTGVKNYANFQAYIFGIPGTNDIMYVSFPYSGTRKLMRWEYSSGRSTEIMTNPPANIFCGSMPGGKMVQAGQWSSGELAFINSVDASIKTVQTTSILGSRKYAIDCDGVNAILFTIDPVVGAPKWYFYLVNADTGSVTRLKTTTAAANETDRAACHGGYDPIRNKFYLIVGLASRYELYTWSVSEGLRYISGGAAPGQYPIYSDQPPCFTNSKDYVCQLWNSGLLSFNKDTYSPRMFHGAVPGAYPIFSNVSAYNKVLNNIGSQPNVLDLATGATQSLVNPSGLTNYANPGETAATLVYQNAIVAYTGTTTGVNPTGSFDISVFDLLGVREVT